MVASRQPSLPLHWTLQLNPAGQLIVAPLQVELPLQAMLQVEPTQPPVQIDSGQLPPGAGGSTPQAGGAHDPAPLHTVMPGHSLSGSAFIGMRPHTPSLPPFLTALQAWQVPPQAVSQHTPSTQLPLAHSFGVAQLTPLLFAGTQLVPSQ